LWIYFDATIGGVTKHFIQEHRFPLLPQTLGSKTIDPKSNRYDEGLAPVPIQLGSEFLSEQFVKDKATLVFPAPEIYENQPLTFSAKNSNRSRSFVYDAEHRRVIFRIVNVNNRVITLDQMLLERRDGNHIIGISWSALGGSLTVDGKTEQDYDRPGKPSTPKMKAPHS